MYSQYPKDVLKTYNNENQYMQPEAGQYSKPVKKKKKRKMCLQVSQIFVICYSIINVSQPEAVQYMI